jgi:hypothetical protein
MQKPSLGRIVIVPVNPTFNNGTDEAPAVICRVWDEEMVNVRILGDSKETTWRTSCKLFDEKPETFHTKEDCVAWWPPRV